MIEHVNYAVYGSLTREVAQELLNRNVHFSPARIPLYGLRMLTPKMMSDAEKEVMGKSSRFVAVPDNRYLQGINGGIIFGLPREEAAVLEFFDNSSPEEYEVKTHEVVALQETGGELENRLPAILVARKKIGRNNGELRDGRNYDPYEPYGGSEQKALVTAREVRTIYLNTLQSGQ